MQPGRHASKVVHSGCAELIAAVESGGVPASTASHLTALPHNQQAEAVAKGAKAVARKVRGLRAGERAALARTGSLGVVCLGARERDAFPANAVLLWAGSGELVAAMEILKKGASASCPRVGSGGATFDGLRLTTAVLASMDSLNTSA